MRFAILHRGKRTEYEWDRGATIGGDPACNAGILGLDPLAACLASL